MRTVGALSILILAALIAFVGSRDRLEAADHPSVAFDWSMADRFGLDGNGDGLVDYFPETSDRPGLTGEIDPGLFEVTLDACDTTGDAPITSYGWTIDGVPEATVAACSHTLLLPEGSYQVQLTATDSEGDQSAVTRDMIVQDWLIVALGDSYGSGEGNPDIPVPGFRFDNLEAAQQELAIAQDEYDEAVANLATVESDYDDTVAQALATGLACGWSDTNGDDLLDTFDLLAIDIVACVEALIDLGLEALADTAALIGEAVNDLVVVAQEAVDVALAALDTAATAVADAVNSVRDAEENFKPTWQDRRCHRSAKAGSALAALELEQSDPRTSVTFVHLACSGAEANVGLLNPYQGVDVELENAPLDCQGNPGSCLQPQIERAAEIVGEREVDILTMSIGGNDANFAPIIVSCITLEPCHVPPPTLDPVIAGGVGATCLAVVGLVLAPFCFDFLDDIVADAVAGGTADELFADGSAELERQPDGSGLYQRVATRFDELLPELADERVYLTEYPNATQDDDGSYCPDINPLNNLPGMSLAEAIFADTVVTQTLDGLVELNADGENWNFVGGVYDAFAGHGYCADDHFMVRMDETFARQGNHTGMVHPNLAGQQVYRDQILAEWLPDLYTGGDLEQPRRPEQPPVADAGGPYFVNEGSSIVLDGSASYSPDFDAISFQWTPTLFLTGSTLTNATTATPTFTAVNDGVHGVSLLVTDDDGSDLDATFVSVNNLPPQLSLGGDELVSEGSTFSSTGSFTDPGVLDVHTATADYGDGTGPQPVAVSSTDTIPLTHVYADDGVYTVSVCVIDDAGGSDCDSLQVTVTNVAPTVDAGGDVIASEGDLVSLAPATFNDRGSLDTHTATVDWGDGTPVEAGAVNETPFGPPGSVSGANGSVLASHVYADDGTYTVDVCVQDDDGGASCDTLSVTVANVAPQVEAGANMSVDEGDVVFLAPATFTDQGTADTHTATIDWGDGTPIESGTVAESPFGPPGSTAGAGGTVSASHAYGDNGTFVVTVCVSDDDSGSSCDVLVVTVNNVAPDLAVGSVAGGAPFVLVLVPVDASATFSDPGFLDTHAAEVDWGDGSPVEALGSVVSPLNASHAYLLPGVYEVTLTVADDDGGSDTETFSIEVVDPIEAVGRIIDDLRALAGDPDTGADAVIAILAALADLEGNNGGSSKNGAFTLLDTEQWGAAVEKIEQALYDLGAAEDADPGLDLAYSQVILAWAANSVANDLIAQAAATATSQGQLKAVSEARRLTSEGNALLALGDFAAAVDKFQKAVGKVD